MNVIRQMFGGGHSDRAETRETIRRAFGDELLLKDHTDVGRQRSKYVGHVQSNLAKLLDTKTGSKGVGKASRKLTIDTQGRGLQPLHAPDERPGRLGPRVVIFDATTGTGRMVLVGDERVSVQGLSNFASIRTCACVFAGSWMYEVQLGTKGIMQIGWCTSHCQFSSDVGVGDTQGSYAFDGARVRKWNVATLKYGEAWTAGDVIGCCIDLNKGGVEFFRNGKSMGKAWSNIPRGSGRAYFPAVSLALQEHLYANFGHVPFAYPVAGYEPMQAAPVRECARAVLLLAAAASMLRDARAQRASAVASVDHGSIKNSLAGSSIGSDNKSTSDTEAKQLASIDDCAMSRKAFIWSLARVIFSELAPLLRLSYVVIAELLPAMRALSGLAESHAAASGAQAKGAFDSFRKDDFVAMAKKMRHHPNEELLQFLDWFWSFLDEVQAGEVMEHCAVRECLLFDLVADDISYKRQIESIYTLCSIMQHRTTRHFLVKNVYFGKISFDNFLHLKSPDEPTLLAVVGAVWWERPTPVAGEQDPLVLEHLNTGSFGADTNEELKKRYFQGCDKINKAIAPLEQIQLEFLKMMLENGDGSERLPSTRKIFMTKFQRYIMDNCILDMRGRFIPQRLNNISRVGPSTALCAYERLQSALLRLWCEETPQVSLALPPRCFYDGTHEFYAVDRLGGVLPFLVRTHRTELVEELGEGHPFLASFEPSHNRNGGIDIAVDDGNNFLTTPGMATLPQVISSIARFMQANGPMLPMPPRSGQTSVSQMHALSGMPGAGGLAAGPSLLRLMDGLFALFHGAASKQMEKLCELRDNQLDLADCLHDIEKRLITVKRELASKDISTSTLKRTPETGAVKERYDERDVLEGIVKELTRSKEVYEEKLRSGSMTMAWVRGALWTRARQTEYGCLFSAALLTLREAAEPGYLGRMAVSSKELFGPNSSITHCRQQLSYNSLELQYSSSSSQSYHSPTPKMETVTEVPEIKSVQTLDQNIQATESAQERKAALFAFVPEYYVEAAVELCNTLRLFMHPTVPSGQLEGWDEQLVHMATFLCGHFADARVVLASARDALVQTLASFATQPHTMAAIERVPAKQQTAMIKELVRPYTGRSWAQSNWVLVRFWHGSGFGYRHRQWPHLAAKYGDREPTVTNLGAKVDAGLMSQCFGPCPSVLIQNRIKEHLMENPETTAAFFNSLLSQLNWAFSEFINMLQEMDRVRSDDSLEPRQIKMAATCFDLYHGLARALEMALNLAPAALTDPTLSHQQCELLLMRTCQVICAVLGRVCCRREGGAAFARLARRGLPDTERVHHYAALAPAAGCLIALLRRDIAEDDQSGKVTRAVVNEPLFKVEAVDFMLGRGNDGIFSFYDYPDDVTTEELQQLEKVSTWLALALPVSSSAASSQDALCTICYARLVDVTFKPCGHHSCRTCIQQHMLNSKQCFFCKAEIVSVQDISVQSLLNI